MNGQLKFELQSEERNMNYWIFSNKPAGTYPDEDWDMSTILQRKAYYLNEKERNRASVEPEDVVYLRIFGESYIGRFMIGGTWVPDLKWKEKHSQKTGAFPMKNIDLWKRPLPQWLIIRDLSNQDIRSRVIRITSEDGMKIETAQKVYQRLGYGGADGEIVILEKGIEEAIKPNLEKMGLKLAGEDVQQQFMMGPGVGRSDLICINKNEDLVVLELKGGMGSDQAIGQVLRYIGYVKENIAKENQKVLGGIVATDYDEHLRLAALAAGIKIYMVRLG